MLEGADIFIGVSKGNLLTSEDIARMSSSAIILAMANPVPETMPDQALEGGAAVVGTGRSDFPNQANNVLAFPGIFRGALDARASRISAEMKIAAANALARSVSVPSAERILPDPLDFRVTPLVAEAVRRTAGIRNERKQSFRRRAGEIYRASRGSRSVMEGDTQPTP